MEINKEVGIIGHFSNKGQQMIFQYPNLLLSHFNYMHFNRKIKKYKKRNKNMLIDLKHKTINNILNQNHVYCRVLNQNPVLNSILSKQGRTYQRKRMTGYLRPKLPI
jgi:hypothetical protein